MQRLLIFLCFLVVAVDGFAIVGAPAFLARVVDGHGPLAMKAVPRTQRRLVPAAISGAALLAFGATRR